MKRHISLLLCFILALTVISPIVIEQSKTKSVQAASAPAEQVCELEDLRTKTSETYLLSDGTRECVVYAENKYYEDAQGKLERIDNSIIETKYSFNKKEYHYQNAANETAVYFAEDGPAVLAVYGSNTLAYNLVGGNETSAIAGGSKKFGRVGDYALYGNNYIAYHGVAEQTDLVFAVHNSGVKEYIVLGNDIAPSEFVFRFEHAGYSIKEVEYGRLGFFDEKGEMVFSLGSLYAVDAAGKYTDQVVYDLKEYDDTSATIAIKLSESYMQDPGRVYPILIDPSVAMTGADQTYDTFVSSKFPNTNYFEDNHLRTGYDDDLYVRRTYMRFIMPSYLYSTAYEITDARIKIRQYIGTTPEAKAYRVTGSWTSGSLTWNNKPGYTTTECSAQATLDNENWYNFVVTTIIKKQLNGTYGDYGVMLKDNTESGTQHWSTFYSSEAASPNKPELHITYIQPSFIVVNYVDAGFTTRFSNGLTKVQTYSEFVKNKFASIFDLFVLYFVNSYSSCADACKLSYVNPINYDCLDDVPCTHSTIHLLTIELSYNLMLDMGTGNNTMTKVLWTGHIMNDHAGDRSQTHPAVHFVIITPYGFVNSSYNNKTDSEVANYGKYVLMHELSHELGAYDQYCLEDYGEPVCTNQYCYQHRSSPIPFPNCIMSLFYDNMEGTSNNAFYCSECIGLIQTHIADHH